MKLKFLLLLIILPSFIFSQKLERNEVDEFTKKSIKETSWEVCVQNFTMNMFFRVRKVDETILLNMKMMLGAGRVFAIHEGDELMLMLSNDTIVKLQALTSEITCTGCGARGFSGSGAQGIKISFGISKDDLRLLSSFPIKKVRIYTTDGYVESEVNKRRGDVMLDLLGLIK